jgi:hypothetical protein
LSDLSAEELLSGRVDCAVLEEVRSDVVDCFSEETECSAEAECLKCASAHGRSDELRSDERHRSNCDADPNAREEVVEKRSLDEAHGERLTFVVLALSHGDEAIENVCGGKSERAGKETDEDLHSVEGIFHRATSTGSTTMPTLSRDVSDEFRATFARATTRGEASALGAAHLARILARTTMTAASTSAATTATRRLVRLTCATTTSAATARSLM